MMKERLVNLIMSTPTIKFLFGSRAQGRTYNTAGNLADHLLKNGVIVPPCKVGDKVYFVHDRVLENCVAMVIKIEQNYYTPSMPIWITIEYYSQTIGRHEQKMSADVFKLLCFPSKEEAEKALAKMKGI